MNWLVDNWYLIVAAAACIIVIVAAIINFCKMSKEQKIANVKEWLKFAVTEAEKALGGGTGQLKLRKVYDMAIAQFPWIAKVIPFEEFSKWVDEALVWLEGQLENNAAINMIVKGE